MDYESFTNEFIVIEKFIKWESTYVKLIKSISFKNYQIFLALFLISRIRLKALI